MKVATLCLTISLVFSASGCVSVARIRIDGSPALLPLVAELASAYEAETGARMQLASGLGSSARAEAVASGRIDFAMASHGIDVAQLAARGLAAHEIARTAVVFAVNGGVQLRAITSSQVCAILEGRIVQWRELGADGGNIVALTRPADEVDAEVARAGIPCLRQGTVARSVRVISRPDSMAVAIASIPGAFGVTSMALVRAGGSGMTALRLDGVEPTAENVVSGAYPLSRSAYLITRARPSEAIARFLNFILSDRGAHIISANGAVPAARIMRSS